MTEWTSHGDKSSEISLDSIGYTCVVIGFYGGIVSCIGDEGGGRCFHQGTLHLDHALQISLSEGRMLGFLYLVALFVLLTPGILVTLPKRGSRYMVAATHAAIFGVAVYLLKRNFRAWNDMEGFQTFKSGVSGVPRVPGVSGVSPAAAPTAPPVKLTPEQWEAKKAAKKAAAAAAAVAAACAACDASKAAENVQGSTMQGSTMQGSTMQGGSGM